LYIEQFVGKMTIDEMSTDKMFVGEMTVDKMTADKIFIGDMTVDKMTEDKMSRQCVCRQDVCR
jgi:hypothetical protein